MSNSSLSQLHTKIDALVSAVEGLQKRNRELSQQLSNCRQRESNWVQERSRLIEKSDLARNRVEAMITRLKSLDDNH